MLSEEVNENIATIAAQAHWGRVFSLEMYHNLTTTVCIGLLGSAILILMVLDLPTEIVPYRQHHIPLKILNDGKSSCSFMDYILESDPNHQKANLGEMVGIQSGQYVVIFVVIVIKNKSGYRNIDKMRNQ